MTDPTQIDQILDQLANGRIDRDEAARRINAIKHPTRFADIPLVEAEFQPSGRVLEDEADPVGSMDSKDLTGERDDPGQDGAGRQPAPSGADDNSWLYENPPARRAEETEPPPADPVDEADADSATGDGPAAARSGESGRRAAGRADDPVVVNLDLDEIARAAGGFVRDAGDLARHALDRLGRLTTTTVNKAANVASEAVNSVTGPADRSLDDGVRAIQLRSVGRRVRIDCDPTAAGYQITGPHSLVRRGETLEISTEGEFAIGDPLRLLRPWSSEELKNLGFGPELVITINPAIRVDAEVTGGRLITNGVGHLGKIRVSVGGANFSGVQQADEVLVQACGATISGPISRGRSMIRVESGTLTLVLEDGADATIKATTQLGKVAWPGRMTGEVDEYIIGDGQARIDLGVVMGRANVRVH